MITIEPRHYKIIRDILNEYPYTFYVYGSRAKGTAHKFSDIDICSLEQVPRSVLGEIEEKFYLSRLPYTVDLTDVTRCSEEFKEAIKKDLIKIPCPENDATL